MNAIRLQASLWTRALSEASACVALGLRDALSPRLLWRSVLLCIGACLFWLWVYYHFIDAITALMSKLALIGTFGLVMSGFQGMTPSQHVGSVAGMGQVATGLLQLGQIFVLVALVLGALFVLTFLFATASTVRLVLPYWLLPAAAGKVLPRYPASPAPAPAGARGPKPLWRILLFALLCLCLPLLAGLTLVFIACYLNVRLIYGSAAQRSAAPQAARQALQWRPLLLIGVALMLMLAIPLLNLLAPALMCTAPLHLMCRALHPVLQSGQEPVAA